jgi:DNA-binding GntR family transcriptional regulator
MVVERFAFAKVIRARVDLDGAPEAAIARQEELAARGDAPGFVEADRAFHRVFVAAAGNPILLALHDSLRDRQARMGLAALARGTHRTEQILLEHRALVDAVAARDEEAAHRLVGEHLGATLALLRGAPVG